MGNLPPIATVIIFLIAFAILSMAAGFFKSAMAQRKIDKAEEARKQAEKKQEEEMRAKAKRKKNNSNPKMKRLGEQPEGKNDQERD